MVTNAMVMATTRVMALAMTWWVMKWAMLRVTRAIVTNDIAAVSVIFTSAVVEAVVIAAAATAIAQCHCHQSSHCSGWCRFVHLSLSLHGTLQVYK
jgi:hypothetical protein